jgi:hypothetical protein
MIGARIGPIELLRDHRTPGIQEISADGNHQTRSTEIEPGPCDSISLAICGDHGVICFRIVTDMRRHAEAGEPGVNKSWKASGFVLVDEDRGASPTPAPRLAEFLRKDLEGLIPCDGLELSVLSRHRATKAIGIVKTLQRCLATGTEGSPVYRMLGISFQLDGATIPRFRDDTAACRTLAASGRIVGRNAWNGLVG